MGTYFSPRGTTAYPALPMGKLNDLDKRVTALEQGGGGGGGSGYQAPTFGTVNGVNTVFVWATAPNAIVIDETRVIRRIQSDGTVNWSGTTTTTLTVAPNIDIYAVA